jgi:hypothetical protein
MLPGLRWVALAALVGSGLAAYAAAGQALGGFDLRAVVPRRWMRGGPLPTTAAGATTEAPLS